MKVKMKVATIYKQKPLKPGDVLDIPEDVALRWGNRGLAIVSKKDLAQKGAEEDGVVQDVCDTATTVGVPSDADSKPADKSRKAAKKG